MATYSKTSKMTQSNGKGKKGTTVIKKSTSKAKDTSALSKRQKYLLAKRRINAKREIALGAEAQKTRRVEAISKTAIAGETTAGGTSIGSDLARNLTTSNSLINPIISQDNEDTTSYSNNSDENTNWINSDSVGGR